LKPEWSSAMSPTSSARLSLSLAHQTPVSSSRWHRGRLSESSLVEGY